MENLDVQLGRPPIAVRVMRSRHGAFCLVIHCALLLRGCCLNRSNMRAPSIKIDFNDDRDKLF